MLSGDHRQSAVFIRQARQLNHLRWLCFSIWAFLLLPYAYIQKHPYSLHLTLLLLAGISVAVLCEFTYRRLEKQQAAVLRTSGPARGIGFYLQAGLDTLLLTAFVYYTGGPSSPAAVVYVLHMGIMASLVKPRNLYLMLAATLVAYLGMNEACLNGWITSPAALVDLSLPLLALRGLEVVMAGAIVANGLVISGRVGPVHEAWMETERNREFLQGLNELVRLGLVYNSLSGLYDVLVRHLVRILQADGACLTAWSAENQRAEILASSWFAANPSQICDQGLTRSLLDREGPLIIPDIDKAEKQYSSVNRSMPAKAILALPLYHYPEKVFSGALIIGYMQPRTFSVEDKQRIQQVVDLISLLIARARLHQETIESADLLREFSERVTQLTLDLQQTSLLAAIVESARNLLKAQRAAVFLYDTGEKQLSCVHSVGLSQDFVDGFNARFLRVPIEVFLGDQTMRLVPDVLGDSRTSPLTDLFIREGFHAYATFSLPSPEGTVGALSVYWDQVHAISSSEIITAQLFAERAGAVLYNASLYARAAEQSVTDDLTGLPNRRALDQRVEEESKRSFRSGKPYTMIMLDLDNFKAINDTYGHPMGDSVLKQVAQALRNAVRETDFVARYGGDEFALILPETDLDSARYVALKLRLALASCDLHMPEATQRIISACMGLASFPLDTNIPAMLLEVADRRLYAAKHSPDGESIVDQDPSAGEPDQTPPGLSPS
jgi:diguanylate cyclase (GGDEF)-like protein